MPSDRRQACLAGTILVLCAVAAAPQALASASAADGSVTWHLAGTGAGSFALRKLLQSALCPVSATNAFLPSKGDPGASTLALLDPNTSPYWTSCRTWKGVTLVYGDEFTNIDTGETQTATYTYTGTLTEAGSDNCATWAARNYPSALISNNTVFTTYLSTTLDKPYDGGAPPVPEDEVCLESYVPSSGTRTNECNSTGYSPWTLTSSYGVSARYTTVACCDYNNCTDIGSFQPYLQGVSTQNNGTGTVPSPSSPNPSSPTGNSSSPNPSSPAGNSSSPNPSSPSSNPSPQATASPTRSSSNGTTGSGTTGSGTSGSGTNSTSSGGGSSSKSNTGVIVGAVVGVVAGVAVLAGVVLFFVCRNRRKQRAHDLGAITANSIPTKQTGKPVGSDDMGGKPMGGMAGAHDGVAVVQLGPLGTSATSLPPPAWGSNTNSTITTNSLSSSAGAAGLDSTGDGKRPKSSMSAGSAGLYGTSGGLQALPEMTPLGGRDATLTMTGHTAGTLTVTQGSSASNASGQMSINSVYSVATAITDHHITLKQQQPAQRCVWSCIHASQAASVSGSVISNRSTVTVLADHMRIRYNELKDFVQIGQGGFSNVFKAKWQGHQVVLKMVRAELATDTQRAALVREALLMRELQHPAVARVYGVVDEAPHHALVMQLYKRGTLEEFMTLPATSSMYDSLSVMERLRMAGQVADGMAYLHERLPPIIHGDLKAANLLVDEDCIAITDFGLAVQLMTSPGGLASGGASGSEPAPRSSLTNLYSTLWTSPTLALSVFISPPEVLTNPNAPRQPSTDVYAFGITLLQIMTGKMPYRGMSADMVISLVKSGKRPAVPEALPWGVRQLIEECWAQQPGNRPTFRQVADRIKTEMTALANSTLAATRSTLSSLSGR